ncbi:MAG TPA: malonic semialdehyde reductase [Hyphomicrobiaceae bacterium]|jgi:3-hydroxypropanoate dehydrogenase|nr:malonic semialdehyde reductase [Hyphomicrobiaceae bacterium]
MRLDDEALGQLFLDARTLRAWQPRQVPDALLREVVDLMKLAPTASNGLPARIVLIKSAAAKARLKPHLDPGNVDRTMAAPATAIVGHDLKFYMHRPAGERPIRGLADKPEEAQVVAFRNGSLQGAYLIMAARALGLDCGPMSGFDNAGVDEEFFAGTDIKSNFLCNLGYGDRTGMPPRAGRFAFDEMASIL